MDINFPFILLCLVLAGTGIWLVDLLWLSKKRMPGQKESALVENAKSLTPVLALVFVIRSFLYEPFQIPSGSMERTLLIGDFILVNKYTYGIRLPVIRNKVFDINEPERGDVMVFFPPHKEQYYIKRVIGLPGDKIRYSSDKRLYINGQLVAENLLGDVPGSLGSAKLYQEKLGSVEHLIRKEMSRYQVDSAGAWTVPAGHYFMMGDNRDNSTDSRYIHEVGFVPLENFIGRAETVVFSMGDGISLRLDRFLQKIR